MDTCSSIEGGKTNIFREAAEFSIIWLNGKKSVIDRGEIKEMHGL